MKCRIYKDIRDIDFCIDFEVLKVKVFIIIFRYDRHAEMNGI